MRILLLSNFFPPESEGGLELSAYEAAMGLFERGHAIEVLTQAPRKPPVKEIAPFPVHRVFEYSYPAQYYGHRLRTLPRRLYDAKRNAEVGQKNLAIADAFAAENAFDVVYAWGFSGLSCAITLPFSRRGLSIVWHVGDFNLRERLYPRVVNKLILGLVNQRWAALERGVDQTHVIANSEFTRRSYLERGFKPEALSVIYRGIQQEIFDAPAEHKDEPPVILMACRVTVQKGVEVAIRAMPLIADAELHIAGVGEPAYVDTVKALIETLGLGRRVKLLGFMDRSEVLERMRKASIVLSASLIEEYFGRVNIEAMACRTPLLASNTDNIREIGTAERDLLVYDQNDPAALATQANRILKDAALAKELVQNGFERVRTTFSQEKIVDQIEGYLLNAAKQV